MNKPVTFQMDFYSDWINLLQSELSDFGYEISGLLPREISFAYCNFKKRLIEPRKRTILKSKNFTCPPDYEIGLNKLKREIESGNDLKPYISKQIMRHDYHDPMLNHWGIYHLHLGEDIDCSGFVTRGNPVLYVRFDSDFAYFIDVRNHGEWSNQEFIQIIHDNWSNTLLGSCLSRSDAEMAYNVSNEDIQKLRKSNINHCIEVDGTIYLQFSGGGGVSSTGMSAEVVTFVLSMERRIKKWQELVELNTSKIVEDLISKGLSVNNGLYEINLCYIESEPYVREKNGLFCLKL